MWNLPDALWNFGIPETVALAAVAVIGYLFGRSGKERDPNAASEDIARASGIALQLEGIASRLRGELSLHRNHVERFRQRLRDASGAADNDAWRTLREEAEAMLTPTLELVSQLSNAYDQIRQQSQALTNYTGSRLDPVTGLSNTKALEEQLGVLLKQNAEGKPAACSLAMLSVEAMTDASQDKAGAVMNLGKAVRQQLRGSDFAARYGMDEIVVVMPKTSLAGGCVFGRRLRASMEVQLGYQVCCGLAEAAPGDSPRSVLARADAALYSARATSPGAQFVHSGASIRPDAPAAESRPGEDAQPSPQDAAACGVG